MLNTKIAFRIFLGALLVIFALIIYFVFFNSSEEPIAEKFFEAIGFESSEPQGSDAVPLPSSDIGSSSGSSSSGSSSGGGSSGSSGNGQVLRFCTFDALHTITSEVPCRCGFSGVCYSAGSVCDATFNNGEGVCS